MPVVVTDLRNGAATFGLMPDTELETVRYVDYGRLANEKTGEVMTLEEIAKDDQLRSKCEKED